MKMIGRVLRAVLWGSTAASVFLAFVWPIAVSADPAGDAFRMFAVGTLVAFLLSLAAVVALGARSGHRRATRQE